VWKCNLFLGPVVSFSRLESFVLTPKVTDATGDTRMSVAPINWKPSPSRDARALLQQKRRDLLPLYKRCAANHDAPPMDTRKLRELGERDALAGKPKEAFYAIPDIEHSEAAREQYEIGYWGTDVELRQEGH
jgi:hypothetical protein